MKHKNAIQVTIEIDIVPTTVLPGEGDEEDDYGGQQDDLNSLAPLLKLFPSPLFGPPLLLAELLTTGLTMIKLVQPWW